jgi:putative Holliday junction resolvase
MRYLGIDYGEKRVGLALGDDAVRVASPFRVIENKGMDMLLAELAKLIEGEEIKQIVVGVPYSLMESKGEAGEQEQAVIDFITRLGMATIVPIAREDERFTSVLVDKLMVGEKLPGGKRDAISAMLILQLYLDKIKDEK